MAKKTALGKEYLEKYQISDMDQWRQFFEEIDTNDHSKMEYQGYAFAGLILVPRAELRKRAEQHISEVFPMIDKAKEMGVSRVDYLGYAKDKLALILSPIFEVSTEVIIRRMDYDSLDTLIP